mgnify:CR=1 FL=1|jgi:hypothetical protein
MTLPAILVLAALPLALLLNGHALAARLHTSTPATRLAVAFLAGLFLLSLHLSVANFFLPLTPLISALCLWPIAATFLHRPTRTQLRHDLLHTLRSRKFLFALALLLLSLAALVSPELTRPDVVFYDASANHDAYFWISGAKRLQTHTYMDVAAIDPAHPWANITPAFSGWQPQWGRVAAENLLAAVASLTARDPVEIYLPFTAALLPAWLAAVYLVVTTFWLQRLSRLALAALIFLQPLFLFSRNNGNLPNLLGALAGAAVVVAFSRALPAGPHRSAWLAFLVLALHALLHSYPELLPFTALPCALLLFRHLRQPHVSSVPLFSAVALAFLLNPATSIRAFHGLLHSIAVARVDADWIDTFAQLHPLQYAPALATLSLPATLFLTPAGGLLASLLLLATLVIAFRRATDRFAAAASLSGGAALLAYTVLTDFSYGWQKSAQFSAIFLAALIPAALSPRFASAAITHLFRAALLAFFACAVVFHTLEQDKWSHRKALTRDWLALRDAQPAFRAETVRVEPATFPYPFFYGMWSAYFLPDTPVVFGPAQHPAGYLRHTVLRADTPDAPNASALLLGPEPAAPPPPDRDFLFRRIAFSLLRSTNIRLPQRPE